MIDVYHEKDGDYTFCVIYEAEHLEENSYKHKFNISFRYTLPADIVEILDTEIFPMLGMMYLRRIPGDYHEEYLEIPKNGAVQIDSRNIKYTIKHNVFTEDKKAATVRRSYDQYGNLIS